MALYYTLVISIVIVAVAVLTTLRFFFKKRLEKTEREITSLIPYNNKNEISQRENTLRQTNANFFIDIETDLAQSFTNQVISFNEEKSFTHYYTNVFHEIISLTKRLEAFYIEPSETVSKFISDFGNIHSLVKTHNEQVIQNELKIHKDFFDHCLKYPLDKQQRRSIVSAEDNCLVVSSAGSGKTSSIVGKVKYLIEIKKVNPKNILIISYTNKAAAELTERMGIANLRGYTFHKLALDIIGQTTGQKPSICDNTDALFIKIYRELLNDDKFKKSVIEYFVDYQTQETDWEQRKNERRQQLSEQKDVCLKAPFPDIDGNLMAHVKTSVAKRRQPNQIYGAYTIQKE